MDLLSFLLIAPMNLVQNYCPVKVIRFFVSSTLSIAPTMPVRKTIHTHMNLGLPLCPQLSVQPLVMNSDLVISQHSDKLKLILRSLSSSHLSSM